MNRTKQYMISIAFFIAIFYLGTICADFIDNRVEALNLSRVKEWSAEVLTHTDLNAEFDNILDHEIANADIAATAAIVASKIDFTTASAIGSTTPSTGAFTTLSTTGNVTLGDATTDIISNVANNIYFEGTTADDYETILTAADTTTADKTITLPNITGTVVTSAGTGGNIDIGAYSLTALTLVSDQATGTAPLTVASTTKVTNLNADTLDGANTATTATASAIYIAGGDGYLPNDTVDTTALKTATSEVSATEAATLTHLTLTGGTYSFYPQIHMENTTSTVYSAKSAGYSNNAFAGWVAYRTAITLYTAGGTDIYAQNRYITASGTELWIFLLIDKNTKDIISTSQAYDHPSYGNGGDPELVPHPFGSYDPDIHEIILLDKETCNTIKQESEETGKSILELVNQDYKPNMEREEIYEPLHSGQFLGEEPVLIETIPDYIWVRKLSKLTNQDKEDKETRNEQKRQEREQAEQAKQTRINQLKSKLNISDEEWELLK